MTNPGDDPNVTNPTDPSVSWEPARSPAAPTLLPGSTPFAAPPAPPAPPGPPSATAPVGQPPTEVIDLSGPVVIDPAVERVQQPVHAASISLPVTSDPFGAAPFAGTAGTATLLAEPAQKTRRAAVTHQEIIDLYAAHHDALVRFAALMAPEDGMAEDLVQEAFVRLYKSWRTIRDPEKVPAYLRSTVANLARGRGRRISTARKHRPVAAPDAASAEEGAIRTETQAEVVALLRSLPDRQRQCLVLRYYEGQTESEIATTLGISVGSVRTHTSRGMAALSAHLGVTP